MQDIRWDTRESKIGAYSITWTDQNGLTHSADARGVDISASGVGVECPREFKPGSIVFVHSRDSSVEGECVVVHCTRRGDNKFHLGLEFREEPAEHSSPVGSRLDSNEP